MEIGYVHTKVQKRDNLVNYLGLLALSDLSDDENQGGGM